MKNKLLLLATLFVALNHALPAAQIGPGGGYFKDFAFHPNNPQIIYAGSDDGGGVWKSQDGGQSWQIISYSYQTDNYRNMTGWHIAIDPLHPDTLWVCDLYSRYGLLRTTDGGATWTNPITGLSSKYDRMVTGLVYGSPAGDTLLISTGNDVGGTPPRPGNGVFRSVNGGQSWQPAGLQGMTVPAICKTILGTVFAATVNNGLYYSNDNGTTWAIHPGLPANLAMNDIEVNGQYVVLAAGPFGVYLSSDYGLTFTNIGLVNDVNFEIAIESTSPDLKLLCATYAGLQRYTLSNNQWNLVSHPEIDGRLVMGLECNANTILVSTFTNSLLLRSTDGGSTFQQLLNSPIATEIADIELMDSSGVGIVMALLGTYGIPGLGNAPCIRITNSQTARGPEAHGISLVRDPATSSRYYLGTFNTGLYATNDTFATFTNIRPGNKLVADVVVNPCNSQVVLISEVDWTTSQWGCYRSSDQGNTFTPVLNEVVNQLYFHPHFCDTIFAATMNGVWVSADTGATWSAYGLQGQNVVSVARGTGYGLAAGTENGLLFEFVNGTPVTRPVPWTGQKRLRSITASILGGFVLTAGGSEQDTTYNLHGGMWESYDLQNWSPSPTLFPNDNFYGAAAAKEGGCNRYTASYGGGVYWQVICLGEEEQPQPAVAPVFPNPCASGEQLTLPFGSGSLAVYDLQGRLIRAEQFTSLQWKAALPPGMYLLHLKDKNGLLITQRLAVGE